MAEKKLYKLMGADGKEYFSETPGTFGGNGRLKIYGRLDCPTALSTIRRFPGSYEKSRVFFADEKTAIAAGFRPCGNCLREKYKEYRNVIPSSLRSGLSLKIQSVCSINSSACRASARFLY